MDKQQRIEEAGKYIEKYYVPGNDDMEMDDVQIKSIFDKISKFLATRKSEQKEAALQGIHLQESHSRGSSEAQAAAVQAASAHPEFDMATAKKKRIVRPMSEMTISSRKMDDLMSQMDETFSRRLIRMIKERNMSEAEVYRKAHVDRRHFSKIKKDEYYAPNKKTVLAFSIALELSLDETKDMLRSAGYALSRSSKFDIIIVYFLENRIYNMFDINEVLFEYGQPIFE